MITILIVASDAEANRILSNFFLEKGMRVLTAGSLEEGLEKAERRHIDIGFVESQLSDGSGLDLNPRLKTLQPYAHVVIITAGSQRSQEEEMLALGAKAFFESPLDLDQLDHWVEHIVATGVDDVGS